MLLKIVGESRKELIVKLALYASLYGFIGINFIDLTAPGSNIPGYHLWLVFQYFAPLIPILFLLGFDDWELVVSMGLMASLFNDLGYYPAGMLLFGRRYDLADFYAFQLGFKGFEVRWFFNGGFFTFPVSSIIMATSIYFRVAAIYLLVYRWWGE